MKLILIAAAIAVSISGCAQTQDIESRLAYDGECTKPGTSPHGVIVHNPNGLHHWSTTNDTTWCEQVAGIDNPVWRKSTSGK